MCCAFSLSILPESVQKSFRIKVGEELTCPPESCFNIPVGTDLQRRGFDYDVGGAVSAAQGKVNSKSVTFLYSSFF